jgi:hypothetical protein
MKCILLFLFLSSWIFSQQRPSAPISRPQGRGPDIKKTITEKKEEHPAPAQGQPKQPIPHEGHKPEPAKTEQAAKPEPAPTPPAPTPATQPEEERLPAAAMPSAAQPADVNTLLQARILPLENEVKKVEENQKNDIQQLAELKKELDGLRATISQMHSQSASVLEARLKNVEQQVKALSRLHEKPTKGAK